MRILLIKLIKIYKKIPGKFHNNCRYIPTCSDYGIEAIKNYGAFKGGFLTVKRILRCNPWGKSGYDPVPKKERKL